ncbi:fumarylpyruvate hydrolase [Devosia enhydra]|uniref:Fumarylpyruvate hydrolase n=1 Tax=Devosia enhydra TaxID=665118 RepID=A0A1K2HV28_9HYPH|nr:fumarylacetoacetate hydrolase family protein [Devosia enhydra]SFZ81532.1 fumarylpyruvate hydrolase [Devosia enhydra]
MTETALAVPAPQPVLVPVAGSDARFPVRRIYCIGRNYADHAREMGHDPDREPPFYFMKSADMVVLEPEAFRYPVQSKDVHFEVELVVAIGAEGTDVPVERALDLVFGYAVGLDMTRRDRQGEAKKLGRPWEVGKAFEGSAPLGTIVPVAKAGHPAKGAITLEVDGAQRQSGDLSEMIWSVPELIAELSRHYRLMPGDLIFTGTPAGVGAVERGQTMTGIVEGVGRISFKVA